MSPDPQEPWSSFLRALDDGLGSPVALHCIGGFVMTMLFGVSRSTSDIDFLVVVGDPNSAVLQELGGQGSELHRRFKVLHPVAVTNYPEDYESRLIPVWEGLSLKNIRLYALEPHDLALTKLERNLGVDRQDVQALAEKGLLDPAVLRARYLTEFRPNLVSGAERHDLTLKFWIEMIRDVQSQGGS
jgi:hypothetical protein